MANDCWQRFQMGALMGASVGACIGVLFGTMYGHGGNGFLRTVGKLALQSGASFGLFMGIGAGIRCDERTQEREMSPAGRRPTLMTMRGSLWRDNQ